MNEQILSYEVLRRMPKVLLHDHLDGGVRPQTALELADERGIELPESDPEALAQWFFRGANRGNLADYLEGFSVTCSLMQDESSLSRVAYELMEDMRDDGVVYTEVRFAPNLHVERGLNVEQVMNAVIDGLERGRRDFGVAFALIVCGLRHMAPTETLKMAELAVAYRGRGCFGFDLAGGEYGHPPKDHIEAFFYCKRENFNITLHAGEAFGPPSIWQAIQYCGAHRIGHCTRLIEDMVLQDGEVVRMGQLSSYVRDHRIPLEICLQSNVHTGATPSLETHPFRWYFERHFRVTLNTDNRLMSNTSMTDEYEVAHRVFGFGADELEKISINSMKSAFIHFDERVTLLERIKADFETLRREGTLPPKKSYWPGEDPRTG